MNSFLSNIPAPSTNSIGFIRIYGLTMAIAIGVAVLIAHKRFSSRNNGSSLIIDIFLPVVLSGIAGARIYHLFTGYNWDRDGIAGTIKLRNGGLSIWGAVIGGALMVAFISRRKKIPFLKIGDCVAVALLVAQAIGRVGNYFNQELFGRELHAPWALSVDIFHRPEGFENIATYHPTFLYEALWCLALAGIIILIERRAKVWPLGASLALYIGGYCLGRTIFEYLRIDDATKVFGVRFNLMLSVVLCVAGFVWLAKLLASKKKTTIKLAQSDLESEKFDAV